MILRSQLDAMNPHLPNVSFDVKTRGCVSIRTDRLNYEVRTNLSCSRLLLTLHSLQEAGGYLIRKLRGQTESFEKEYYDLIRSAFLKYSFQARIGDMDGCFVAYHNGSRVFGFQYIPIVEMDEALYGSHEEGNMVYSLVVAFLEKVLTTARDAYPGRSIKLTFETIGGKLDIFVEPVEPLEGDVPMTLISLEGANYVDNIGTWQVDIGSSVTKRAEAIERAWPSDHIITASTNSALPTWDVGYNLTIHDGINSEVTAQNIAHRFAVTRAHQTIFDTINLPTGVTAASVLTAQAEAAQAIKEGATPSLLGTIGVGLTLAEKFPEIEGLTYLSKMRAPLAKLRRANRQGAADTKARRAEDEERGTFVQMTDSAASVRSNGD